MRRCGCGLFANCPVIQGAMRYFLRFLLALVMAALLVVTYGNIQAIGNQDLKLEKVTNMAYIKSKRSKKFKQNDLQLKENDLQLKME